tara:strand:- start:376 stop:693 length:318 start_codon:yes stop_codon:yes gene_type:complete
MNLNLADIKPVEIMPGFHGKLIHTDQISMAFWEVKKGAEVTSHSHMNEQIMHVMEGEFQFTLEGDTKVCHSGDIVIIPPNKLHSGKALTNCKLMDIFCPTREEYR